MKKIKLIYKISIVLLLSISLSACFKPKEILIDQESKDYCLFGEGSYWIYQDSATLKVNNIVIDMPIIHEFIPFGGYNGEVYSTNISLYSHNDVRSLEVSLTTKFADPKLLKPSVLWLSKESLNNWGFYYHSGEIEKHIPYVRPNTLILIEKKDNYSINGVKYSNIKIFESSYLEERKRCYWAKHIGLIRTEIYKNDSVIVKNLIRYNVKPYNQ